MELRHLRYFIAVAEELHFSRAARKLNVAQPPLSQQIRGLEKELGFQLFYRTKRRVELTDAGTMFLEEARLTLGQAEQAAMAAARASRGEIGHLEIGITATTAYIACPKIIRVFGAQFPEVNFRLRQLPSLEHSQALLRRQIHISFVHVGHPESRLDQALEAKPVAQEEWIVALPEEHRLARLSQIPLEELATENFILFPRDTRPDLYDQIITSCGRAGFSPNVVHETYPPQTTIGLVSTGIAISLVSASLQSIQLPGVVYRPLSPPLLAGEIIAMWKKDDASPTVRALLKTIDEVTVGEVSRTR